MSVIKIVNTETGEEIERPMTAQELKEWEDGIAFSDKKRAVARSAREKLIALGLTEEEIAAL